ncbi:hypothetical protein GB937_009194 [Aspergillus fischeri]|nr:hypothetical protein GB937_009194 [Aspergillus fischeri]
MEKTPEKTRDDWSSFARIDRNMLSSKQKISGPLHIVLNMLASHSAVSVDHSHLPKIPVTQTLTHSTLQDHVGIRPASYKASESATEPGRFASLGGPDASSAALQHTSHQVLGPQHLAQLLPYRSQVA